MSNKAIVTVAAVACVAIVASIPYLLNRRCDKHPLCRAARFGVSMFV